MFELNKMEMETEVRYLLCVLLLACQVLLVT